MKIDILCTDGSPIGVTLDALSSKSRIGVGGAEYALLTMCEEWAKAGHRVRLYNNPKDEVSRPIEQLPIYYFTPTERRDVLIVFRSPNNMAELSNGKKIWWSCDQYTIGDFKSFSKIVDSVVCISPHHAEYFNNHYGIKKTTVIDLPVRVHEYSTEVEKIPYRCMFTSVPDRGLKLMKLVWDIVHKEEPRSSLVITSDYRLWGTHDPLNAQHRTEWFDTQGVRFLGAIPRPFLVKEQLEAELLTYPCIYEELFCIACAEAQVAGAYPITTGIGALKTTNMGYIIDGDIHSRSFIKGFADAILDHFEDNDWKEKSAKLREKALARFSPTRIIDEWNKKVFN